LARALGPVTTDHAGLSRALDSFTGELDTQFRHMMLRKLGLVGHRNFAAADDELLGSLGTLLVEVETDMTLFFRRLAQLPLARPDIAPLRDAFYAPPDAAFRAMLLDW